MFSFYLDDSLAKVLMIIVLTILVMESANTIVELLIELFFSANNAKKGSGSEEPNATNLSREQEILIARKDLNGLH